MTCLALSYVDKEKPIPKRLLTLMSQHSAAIGFHKAFIEWRLYEYAHNVMSIDIYFEIMVKISETQTKLYEAIEGNSRQYDIHKRQCSMALTNTCTNAFVCIILCFPDNLTCMRHAWDHLSLWHRWGTDWRCHLVVASPRCHCQRVSAAWLAAE